MSLAAKGKIVSEETKYKMSQVNIGKHAGEKHQLAKLTWIKVREIREMYSAGNISQSKLAVQYGVKNATISDIITHKTWRE